MLVAIEHIISASLRELAADSHARSWQAKEHDWVNYYAHRFLLAHVAPKSVLRDASQVAIEVAVPQPPGYDRPAVNRDLVIWSAGGDTAWDSEHHPSRHPLALIEWKVHRVKHRNPDVRKEREWLRQYCRWQPQVLAYAVEIDGTKKPATLTCARFQGSDEQADWLRFTLS